MNHEAMREWASKIRGVFRNTNETLAAFDVYATLDPVSWTPESRSFLEGYCADLDRKP